MKSKEKKILTLTLEGEEIESFKGLLQKIDSNNHKIGFNAERLSSPEKELLTDLQKTVK